MKVIIKPVAFEIFDENEKRVGDLIKRDKDCFDISVKACVSTGGMTDIGARIDYVMGRSNEDIYTAYLKGKK